MEKENDIDSLARMVADGFAGIEKRFEQVDERFDRIDERFDGVEGRLGSLEAEVRGINQRLDTVVVPALDSYAHRIKKLEEQIVV